MKDFSTKRVAKPWIRAQACWLYVCQSDLEREVIWYLWGRQLVRWWISGGKAERSLVACAACRVLFKEVSIKQVPYWDWFFYHWWKYRFLCLGCPSTFCLVRTFHSLVSQDCKVGFFFWEMLRSIEGEIETELKSPEFVPSALFEWLFFLPGED